MKSSMNRVFIFTKRNIKEILRDPVSLIFLFAMPIFMLILFNLVFSNLTYQFKIMYLAPGMISFSHVFLTLFVGSLICGDKESSFMSRLYSTPLKSKEFIFGYILSIIPIGLLQTLVILVLACILDTSFLSVNILLCIPFSIVSILLFVGFGVLFGCLLNSKSIGGISSILIMGQSMLSGMWFPLDTLDDGFNKFIRFLPFRSGSLLFQNLCVGFNENFVIDIIHPLVVILLYSVIIITISIIVYRYKMKEK